MSKLTRRLRGRHFDRDGERGFTLVELAIVLVIIGLVIAGVLKGQELITNARLKTTTSDVEAMRSAVNTFRDKYGALPGDYAQANTRIGAAAGVTLNDGDGDGIVEGDGVGGGTPDETVDFWNHLAAADLVKGISPVGAATFGDGLPSAPIGGGFTLANESVVGRTAHWLRLGSAAASPTGVVDSAQALDIDSKIDDGRPATGTTRMSTFSCVNDDDADTAVSSGDSYSGAPVAGCLMNFEVQ